MNKKEFAEYAKRAKCVDKDAAIHRSCSGKRVLDVGCVGQDRAYDGGNWLHAKLKSIAAVVDGVDILEPEVKELRSRGYSVYTPAELSAIGKKYDVVLMADVIEHVNDPVEFLKFYSGFLDTGGIMLITTPNATRSLSFINILFNNTYSVNEEHTFWFCPKTFSEITARARVTIQEFYWSGNYYELSGIKNTYQRIKQWLAKWLYGVRPHFSPNMIFTIVRNER